MNALIAAWMRWRRSLWRWKYVILAHRDHAALLNRSVEVENILRACAAGKRDPLSKEECRQLAHLLGVPDEFRLLNDRLARPLEDELEAAWGLIANAGGGDWQKESLEWREAAIRWRDRYHALVVPHEHPNK